MRYDWKYVYHHYKNVKNVYYRTSRIAMYENCARLLVFAFVYVQLRSGVSLSFKSFVLAGVTIIRGFIVHQFGGVSNWFDDIFSLNVCGWCLVISDFYGTNGVLDGIYLFHSWHGCVFLNLAHTIIMLEFFLGAVVEIINKYVRSVCVQNTWFSSMDTSCSGDIPISCAISGGCMMNVNTVPLLSVTRIVIDLVIRVASITKGFKVIQFQLSS